jgi:hypothetical protein
VVVGDDVGDDRLLVGSLDVDIFGVEKADLVSRFLKLAFFVRIEEAK